MSLFSWLFPAKPAPPKAPRRIRRAQKKSNFAVNALNASAKKRYSFDRGGKAPEPMKLGHHVADIMTEEGIGSNATTGDAESRWDRQTLVNTSRKMYDENLIFSTIVDRMTSNLMGAKGYSLQARTGSKRVNRLIENEIWKAFVQDPDFREMRNWVEIQHGVCRDMLGPGDIGFVKVVNGKLQAIESEWINTPTNDQQAKTATGIIEQGIELTNTGRLRGYWVTPPSVEGYGSLMEGKRYDTKDFIYVSAPVQRFSRTRPIPPFVQVFTSIWRFDDILNSEAVSWQLLAKNSYIVTKRGAEGEAWDLSEERDSLPYPDTLTDRFFESEEGQIFFGEEGEEVKGVDRNLPGKDFPNSVRAFMQLFAMRIGLPLEILMLDWSKTNFSSGRAALSQATMNIRAWQANLIEKFYKPVYEWVIDRAIADGRLQWRPDIYDCEWFPPNLPWVDPKEEAEAWAIQIKNGLVTYADALKHNNKDYDTQASAIQNIILDAIAKAKEVEEQTGEKVSWKLFAGMEEGKTEAAMSQPKETEEEEPAEEPKEEPEVTEEEEAALAEEGYYIVNKQLYKMDTATKGLSICD